MIKRILTCFICLFSAVLFASVSVPFAAPALESETEAQIYRKLYDGDAKHRYEAIPALARHRASYGYAFNMAQGYNNWYYQAYDDGYEYMRYQEGVWSAGRSTIQDAVMTPALGVSAVRTFLAPVTGRAAVSGTVRMHTAIGSNLQSRVRIVRNDVQIYPADAPLIIGGNDTVGYYHAFELDLTAGDLISFIVSGDGPVYWNPTVDYTNQISDTLYDLPPWGYYGDFHQYYYNDTVNLYHLSMEDWTWYQILSRDMFRYETASYYNTAFVENHYMSFDSARDLNDYAIYPAGSRDNTLFYDEDIDRYRYLSLSYKVWSNGVENCDLSLRTSDDSGGFRFSAPAVALREFPHTADGEPECAGFRKIGNRWYLYCGISRQSIHHVGGISYWIGGENQSIDEVDWKSLPTHQLDGEDLCVPQIEAVDEKWYLFGWMPRVYNSSDWGGYRNMSREVYQRPDGILATRLDPYAQKQLNKGKIATFNQANIIPVTGILETNDETLTFGGNDMGRARIDGTFDSTFVTFQVSLQGGTTEAGFVMTSGGRDYRLLIQNQNNQIYLQIDCLTDPTHPVSSRVLLETDERQEFAVKAIIEGGIVEFYVNDLITLSGRTGMGAAYQAAVFSNGPAVFRNVHINRLSQLYDIYD